ARELLQMNSRSDAPAGRVTTGGPKTGKKLARRRCGVADGEGPPCHRCGTMIEEKSQGTELPRTTYFCPSCQASVTAAAASGGGRRARGRRAASRARARAV